MNQQSRIKLDSINLKGFKSINSDGQTVCFGDITVLLGANGAGKSNLVSFFSMLNYMMTGSLQTYIGENGFAEALLYYGAKVTNRIEATIRFSNNQETDKYHFNLSHAVGDTLIFTNETLSYWKKGKEKPFEYSLSPGSKESGLLAEIKQKDNKSKTGRIIYGLLRNCQVFQFHDTSKTSKIRSKGYINDNRFLRSDGGNLAAFLYAMKNKEGGERYYRRIIRHIQQIMPQFKDFELEPSRLNKDYVMLNWYETGSDYLFGPHQLSDGSLRFMALATLLLQPHETLPSVIILDEPELGLHPSAISILAGMARQASRKCQIVMATQSQRLVDEFEAGNIVVAERNEIGNYSEFKQLEEEKLMEWLERYSLSELWEKNVLGGQP